MLGPDVAFSALVAPLYEKFGGALTVSRVGQTVCWDIHDLSAFVELTPHGDLLATFVDRSGIDVASQKRLVAAYRVRIPYALDRSSCGRMAADLVEFFSGVREPKFRFVNAYPA